MLGEKPPYVSEIYSVDPEECAVIKEKVKKFIATRNAQEGVTESGLGDAGTPSTPTVEIPSKDGTGALGEDAAQDGVGN